MNSCKHKFIDKGPDGVYYCVECREKCIVTLSASSVNISQMQVTPSIPCPVCGKPWATQKLHCPRHDVTFEPGTECTRCVIEREESAAKEADNVAAGDSGGTGTADSKV